MKLNRGTAWLIAIIGALALFLLWAYWPRAVPADIAKIAVGPMQVTIEDDAVTRVRETYVISAPIAGRLLRIETHAGDAITADETVIAQIMPADPALFDARTRRELEFSVSAAKAARDLAAASMRAAEARLKEARLERDRDKELFAKGHVAKAKLDRSSMQAEAAAADLATAQAALRQRAFDVKTAETSLLAPAELVGEDRFLNVRSPVSGSVLRLIQESEGVVAAGQPLIEVGDPADLEIVLDLLSTDAVQVAPGAEAIITRWGGQGSLTGRVTRVEPSGFLKVSSLGVEEQRVNVLIDLTDPHERWARLGHGYQLDAAVVLWRSEAALKLPLSALFRAGEDWAVFIVDGGRARERRVEIGHTNRDVAEILSGLETGDEVVLYPSERVRDGVRVRPRN